MKRLIQGTTLLQKSLIATMMVSIITAGALAAQKSSSSKKSSKSATKATTTATPVAQAQSAAAPAQTLVLSKPVEQAPLGRFGLGLVLDTSIVDDSLRHLGSDNAIASSINLVSLSYKLSETDKIALKQYWTQEYGSKPDSAPKANWTVATYSTKTKGILGSDAIAPLFWYYIPTTANEGLSNGYDGEQINHYGILRADIEVAWTLTPKWSTSYYFNPRQSFVQGEQRIYAKDAATGKMSLADVATNKTTIIHYAYLYYSWTDKFQTYGAIGFRNEFLTNESFLNSKNGGLPVLGLNYNMSKNIALNFEINQEVPLSKTSYSEEAKTNKLIKDTAQKHEPWLDSHDLSYELVVSLSM